MFTRKFILILVIELCYQMGSFVVNPIVPSYVVALGGAVMVGGFIVGLNSIMSLASRPFVGAFVDRLDFTKLLILSCALSSVFAFATAVVQGIAIVAVCRIAFGLSFAFKSAVIVAMARLVLPRERVVTGLSYVSLMYVLANALGPMIGTEIGARFGYGSCFLVSAALFFTGLILSFFLYSNKEARALFSRQNAGDEQLKEDGVSLGAKNTGVHALLHRVLYLPVIVPTVMAGLVSFTLGSTNTLLVLAMDDRGIPNVSLFFLIAAVVMFFSRMIAGKACDKRGFFVVFLPASVLAVLSMALLSVADSLLVLLIAAACLAAGQCTLTMLIQSENMRNVPEEYSGRASNTLLLGPDIGMFLGPSVGGVVLQVAGSSILFAVNAFVILAMIVLYFVSVHQRS